MRTVKNKVIHSLLIMILLVVFVKSQLTSDNLDNSIISSVKSQIDSIDTELDELLKSNKSTITLKRKTQKIVKDTVITKTENDTIACSFRNADLDSQYYDEYYSTGEPDTIDTTLCIVPHENTACNLKTEKIVYGFANMHNRKTPLKIDFKLFDRIGIYSIFPEKYGNIEMIFKGNNTVKNYQNCFVKYAHRYNTKVDLVVSKYQWKNEASAKSVSKEFSANEKLRIDQDVVILSMIDSLVSILRVHEFDGITFDFDIGEMDNNDISNYRELLYFVHKELIKDKKFLNIVINKKDIYAPLCTLNTINDTIDTLKIEEEKNKSYTKVEFLLEPYLITQINCLIINDIDIEDNSLDSIKNKFRKSYVKNSIPNIIGMLSACVKETDLANSIATIFDKKMGIALWAIDTIKSDLSEKISVFKYGNSSIINFPRKFIITDEFLMPIRSFFDSNRTTILIIISFFIVLFFSFIAILRITGREKYLEKNKVVVIVTGVILYVLSCLYIQLYPFDMNVPVFWIIVGTTLMFFLLIVAHKSYKSTKRDDLP